jgi:DNA-binding IclR family transcriptional regulator
MDRRWPTAGAHIASLTGIPQPTVSRLVATLVALGHLRPSAGADKYELASGVVRLAEAFLAAIDVRAWARPRLVALAEATGASAFLAVRDGDEMLVVESGRSRSAVVVMGTDVGTRMSITTSALGRAWLAGVDETTRDAVIAHWRARAARKQPAIGPALETSLAHARERGYALSIGEWHPSINAAAVPVRTAAGEVVAVNCGGPSLVVSAERLQDVVLPRLLAAADALAKDIGGVAGRALTFQSTEAPRKKHRLSTIGA